MFQTRFVNLNEPSMAYSLIMNSCDKMVRIIAIYVKQGLVMSATDQIKSLQQLYYRPTNHKS